MNRLGIDETKSNMSLSPSVTDALDKGAALAEESRLSQTHSGHILVGIVNALPTDHSLRRLVAVPEVSHAVEGINFGDSRSPDWTGVSRRYRISSNGRLACNFAIDMAGAAGRKVAEPSDLLIALLLNESSSASLALERLRQGMAVEVLEMAKRLSDLPAGVLEKCWSESESQEMVRVRESPRPTTSR